ncbi:MAG: peptidoglycan DD-metalloendopeptidase family protein [Rhizobiaceae bacterium]|nr:peptidoglycan DD-metalloendopeptidase family protein [Rhizobiaceae bacterium]
MDTILGEAVAGSRSVRFEDMLNIASTIANRAAATGVSMQQIVSAPNQYSAYGKSLPPGVEKYRDLAQKALEHVQTKGPVTTATYYATPSATKNLPSGLQPVAQTRGHQFFDDPQNRGIRTAVGVRQPGLVAYDIVPEETAASRDLLGAVFGAPTSKRSVADQVFGTASPSARPGILNDVFGPRTGTAAATVGTGIALGALDDGPTAEWDGTFSSPLGAVTDRTTSGFGLRDAPNTSLGVGSTNHAGIDLAERGQVGYAANAAGPGIVTHAGPLGNYGTAVTVEHPNGFTSVYGHLQSVGVKKGDEIAKGTPVGLVGASGNVSGPHLHFEMRDPLGQPVNPRDVVDFTRRDLAATPTSRPMSPTEQRNTAAAYGNMAASMANAGVLGVGRAAPSSGLPAGFDTARFAGDVMPSRPSGAPSPASSQMAAFAGPQPSRSPSPASMPSPERFGYAPAAASAPKAGGLGGLGGAKAAPDPARFGPAEMTSTAKTGRLSSTVTPSTATPMSSMRDTMTAGLSQDPHVSLAEPHTVSLSSASPSAMGMLPSKYSAPLGPASTFNPTPSISMTDYKGQIVTAPVTTLPTSVVPLSLPAVPAPTVQPMVTPVAKQPVSPQTTASIPTSRPSFSAYDVHNGVAPVGYQAPATGGNLVSRDQFGNTHVTNQFGVTTVTDPTGRQMGTLGGLGKGIGSVFDKATPGMVGAVVGGAIAGFPGAVAGYALGSRASGQTGQKSGGLGGLGGFLSGLFGGGSSSGGGGSSSGGRGGGSSGSRGGPPGADRDHAGN